MKLAATRCFYSTPLEPILARISETDEGSTPPPTARAKRGKMSESLIAVGMERLELSRTNVHSVLSAARLPIPPHPQ